MTAANAVFETYELLENALLHLDAKDVARLMRVSKTWHAVIAKSSALRDVRILPPLEKAKRGVEIHGLHAPVPSYKAEHSGEYYIPYNLKRGSCWVCPPGYFDESDIHRFKCCGKTAIEQFRLARGDQDHYMTSPPIRALDFCLDGFYSPCTIYVKDGIRFQHVQEALESIIKTIQYYSSGKQGWFTRPQITLSFETLEEGALRGWK